MFFSGSCGALSLCFGESVVTNIEPWQCPTCKTNVDTAYCPACGERVMHARDLTLRGLLENMFAAFTNLDFRLLRSFRRLVSSPGFLTVAYLDGRRKPYLTPVSVFLVANVFFFAIETLSGGKIFTTPLDSHLHTQPWSELTPQLVEHRLSEKQMTLELYAPVFDQALATKARSLIIFMALAFSFLPALLFLGSRRPLVAHVAFSLHFYAFLLLLFSIATAIPPVESWLGGDGFESEVLDHFLAVSLVIASAVYLYFAMATVYGARGIARVLKTAALSAGVVGIVLGYRFVLLLITLYTT